MKATSCFERGCRKKRETKMDIWKGSEENSEWVVWSRLKEGKPWTKENYACWCLVLYRNKSKTATQKHALKIQEMCSSFEKKKKKKQKNKQAKRRVRWGGARRAPSHPKPSNAQHPQKIFKKPRKGLGEVTRPGPPHLNLNLPKKIPKSKSKTNTMWKRSSCPKPVFGFSFLSETKNSREH